MSETLGTWGGVTLGKFVGPKPGPGDAARTRRWYQITTGDAFVQMTERDAVRVAVRILEDFTGFPHEPLTTGPEEG